MATKRKTKVTPKEASPAVEPEAKAAPAPLNRGVGKAKADAENIHAGWIQVIANRPIGEYDRDGEMRRYKTGDVFYLDHKRAKALGQQVTITKG